jgi:uncharacterized YigZ family protein
VSDIFKTILSPTEALYKDKGSKFFAFAVPVTNVDEVKEKLQDYRKQFFDARHVCYAYMLGAERLEFRANDDGEPSGTAGRPILGQINSRDLTNVLVVVVRYFGGILLGTSGLINAYKLSAAEALDAADIIEVDVLETFDVLFHYPLMNEVMRIVKDYNLKVIQQDFRETCCMSVACHPSKLQMIKSKFVDLYGVGVKLNND